MEEGSDGSLYVTSLPGGPGGVAAGRPGGAARPDPHGPGQRGRRRARRPSGLAVSKPATSTCARPKATGCPGSRPAPPPPRPTPTCGSPATSSGPRTGWWSPPTYSAAPTASTRRRARWVEIELASGGHARTEPGRFDGRQGDRRRRREVRHRAHRPAPRHSRTPELSWSELRTTAVVAAASSGRLAVTRYCRTGFAGDVVTGGPLVALRADMDALPLPDHSGDPWVGRGRAWRTPVGTTSTRRAARRRAGARRRARRGLLPGRVRLIFQPAEEQLPGGALDVVAAGGSRRGRARLRAALRPATPTSARSGSRVGAITAASDQVDVRPAARAGTPRGRT